MFSVELCIGFALSLLVHLDRSAERADNRCHHDGEQR